MPDSIVAVSTAKQTLYKLSRPSIGCWLVAHNGKDKAHVVEMTTGLECLTGLGSLEKFSTQKDAESRAKAVGWTAPKEAVAVEGSIRG